MASPNPGKAIPSSGTSCRKFGAVLAIGVLPVFLAAQPREDVFIVMLGTGTPNPDPERAGPSLAIIVNSRSYVVDAGVGVVRRAAQAARNGFPSLNSEGLTHLFLTHLHSDHTVGYPDFIFTPAVTGRLTALDVYGPAGTNKMTKFLLKAYKRDLDIRLRKGLEPAVPEAYKIHVHEIHHDGLVFEEQDKSVKVYAFRVRHGNLREAYGYKFVISSGKTIVVSGDTTYSDQLIANAMGCDILIHEAYSALGLTHRTAAWQRYHSSFHTSAVDLGKIAAQVKPRVLVVYHGLPFGATTESMVSEIRQNFSGSVIYAADLQVIR